MGTLEIAKILACSSSVVKLGTYSRAYNFFPSARILFSIHFPESSQRKEPKNFLFLHGVSRVKSSRYSAGFLGGGLRFQIPKHFWTSLKSLFDDIITLHKVVVTNGQYFRIVLDKCRIDLN